MSESNDLDDGNGLWGRVMGDSRSYGTGLWSRVAGESEDDSSGLWSRVSGSNGDTQGLWAETSGASGYGERAMRPAHVRLLHASPDAPAVDVWIDGAMAAMNLSYGEGTPYVAVGSGNHLVEVVPTGETEPVVLSAEVDFAPRFAYSIVAIGTAENLTALALEDTTRPRGANAHVRFVHASPDAPAVDVGLAGGATIFGNASFGDATEYARIPRGTYDLEARLAGTDTVALEIPDVELDRRTAYTAYAVGLAADGSLTVLLTKDMGRG